MYAARFAALALIASASLAQAHEGPRIFLGNSNGRIYTLVGNNEQDSTSFTSQRIFTQELPNFLNSGIYTTDFPGYQVAEGTGVAAGTSFTFNIAGPLYYFSHFDPAASTGVFQTATQAFAGSTVPQFAISETNDIRITAGAPVPGFEFFTYNAPGDHDHLTYTLFGNGLSASDGPAGVYLLPLEVTSSALTTSEPFYLLLGKDVSLGSAQFDAAVSAVNVQFIPEPTQLGILIPLAAFLLRRR